MGNLNTLGICSAVFLGLAILCWAIYIGIITGTSVDEDIPLPYVPGFRTATKIGALLFTFGTFICVVFNRSNWGIPGSLGNWYNIYCLTGIIVAGIGIILLIVTFGPDFMNPSFSKDYPKLSRFFGALLTIVGCWLLFAPDITPPDCSK
jgi:hypothetical protein